MSTYILSSMDYLYGASVRLFNMSVDFVLSTVLYVFFVACFGYLIFNLFFYLGSGHVADFSLQKILGTGFIYAMLISALPGYIYNVISYFIAGIRMVKYGLFYLYFSMFINGSSAFIFLFLTFSFGDSRRAVGYNGASDYSFDRLIAAVISPSSNTAGWVALTSSLTALLSVAIATFLVWYLVPREIVRRRPERLAALAEALH